MLVFASPVPTAFGTLQSRYPVERPSAEEQYFKSLAEQHERAAALARKRMEEAQQQRELEALQRLAAIQAQQSPYDFPPHPLFGRTLPGPSDVIFGSNTSDLYAERIHRQRQLAALERQKRAEQQDVLRALFEQRRAEVRRRAEEARAQQERQRKAQQSAQTEQARRHLAARAADEAPLREFFQTLLSAMGATSIESQGADLERKNAIHRSSVPVLPQGKPQEPISVPAPVSPQPERPASPTPSVASNASDASLTSIALLQNKYNNLRTGFQFPTNLVFAPSTSPHTPASSPTLLFNPTNAPVHAYEHALTNLLTELDAVESFGDEHVRDVRRTLVKSVEAELEALEERKRQAWRNQQEAPLEPATAESAKSTAPAESALAPTFSGSVPAVESTVEPESTPANLAPTTDVPDLVAWFTSRLSQPLESEDDEVKAVRENLLAQLASFEGISSRARAVLAETEAENKLVGESPKSDAIEVSQPETITVESSEPDVLVAPVTPKSSPGSTAEPTPESESEPEPEAEAVQLPALIPQPEIIVTEAATEDVVHPEPELETSVAGESVTAPEASSEPESESDAAPLSPVASVPESIASTSEPEVIVKDEARELELAPSSPEHQSTFVQVFPDSDSDSDVDSEAEADMAAELAEADKKNANAGEEFEFL